MRRMTLTKAEKRMWPILEVQVRQVRKDGSKIRGSSKWVSYCQREIRRMLPKRVRVHFGLTAGLLAGVLLLAGCKTWNAANDTAQKWWDAGGATLSIVRAAGDDVGSVFVEAGLVKGEVDATPVSEPVSGVTK